MALPYLVMHGAVPPICRGGAIAIGNFDGVHLGHQALMAAAREEAAQFGGPAIAVTFDPHPLQLLRPESFQPVLTTLDHRAVCLRRAGADQVIVLRTTPELLQWTSREFFQRLIVKGLEARGVVEGFNFFFGKGREGNLNTLKDYCQQAGLTLQVVAPIELDGKVVSSSRVRDDLLAGKVDLAMALLGRRYQISGIVGTGQRRGQSLGFPTANLERIQTIIPGNGVYAVEAQVDGRPWPAAANIGPNPTFGEQERKVEVHLIGFHGDLYGQPLAIAFIAKLRDTRSFAGPADLALQIRLDVAQAGQFFH